MFDTSMFLANSPEKLLKAHTLLEAYIKDFAEKADTEAEMLVKYRQKVSSGLKTAREASIPVTIMVDQVKGDCAREKADYMKATAEKKKAQYNIESMKERIYSIRHLNKSIEGQLQSS